MQSCVTINILVKKWGGNQYYHTSVIHVYSHFCSWDVHAHADRRYWCVNNRWTIYSKAGYKSNSLHRMHSDQYTRPACSEWAEMIESIVTVLILCYTIPAIYISCIPDCASQFYGALPTASTLGSFLLQYTVPGDRCQVDSCSLDQHQHQGEALQHHLDHCRKKGWFVHHTINTVGIQINSTTCSVALNGLIINKLWWYPQVFFLHHW